MSTGERNLDARLDALKAAGAGRVFADRIGGSLRKRPELDQLRKGDIVVHYLYRIHRSMKPRIQVKNS